MSYEKNSVPKLENQQDFKASLLDLPEWTLNCILERLSPQDLCRVAQVCTPLRHRIRSDDLWDKQLQKKWSSVLGDVVNREWQWHTTKINTQSHMLQQNQSGSCGSISGVWPFLSFCSYLEDFRVLIDLFQNCSKLALFVCLETGRFWFPAQVYKNAQIYCYDAIVSYDSSTDTFSARSPTGGWRMIEENVKWDRLRLSPVETSSWDFYVSNCMHELKPGDYVEIQRRRRKEFPYDWWFAVVGHLDSCGKDFYRCRCQDSDQLVVEYGQFLSRENRWRRSVLNRNLYEEQGSRLCWFGGIRKLDKQEEIQRWKSLYAARFNPPFMHGQHTLQLLPGFDMQN